LICCCTWRAPRRWIWRRFRCWLWPNNILFVEKARALRLELAADYLVMAAWLAYLKSRLLIPQSPKGDEPSGEEMAAQLAFRLKRLEAMREAATRLVNRNRLGRDVFARGAPEAMVTDRTSSFRGDAL
jgi:segregation and condensation protein A